MNTTKMHVAGGVVKIAKPTPSVSLLKPTVIQAIAQNHPLINVDPHKKFPEVLL